MYLRVEEYGYGMRALLCHVNILVAEKQKEEVEAAVEEAEGSGRRLLTPRCRRQNNSAARGRARVRVGSSRAQLVN